MKAKKVLSCLLAAKLACVSAGAEGSDEAVGITDAGPEAMAADEAFQDVDLDSAFTQQDLSERLAPGQVRAGKVAKGADLIGGRTAKGRIGDFKIYNSKVAFIVQDAGLASGYKRYGGGLVDADIVRAEGEKGQSQLGEMFFGFNFRLFEPTEAEVVSDGRDGRAIVRVRGKDGYFPWLGSFLGDLVPSEPLGLEIVYEYSLGPDDDFLTWDVSITNISSDTVDLISGVAFIMGDGLKTHFPGPGFDAEAHQGEYPYWAALGDFLSYGLLAAEGPIQMAFHYSNVAFGFYPNVSLQPGETRTLRRYFAVTGGGLDKIAEIFRPLQNAVPVGVLRGVVESDEKALARGIRVHVLSKKGDHLYVIRPDNKGHFETTLPLGEYVLFAKANGYAPSSEVTAHINTQSVADVTLQMPLSTPFEYLVVAENAQPIPARLSFFRADGQPTNILGKKFGEEVYPLGASLMVFSGTGEGGGVLPPGPYHVWVTRGILYERAFAEIVAGAEPLSLKFSLKKAVDSKGYLSTDAHIHAEHSPDTDISELDRVLTALADGLDVPILTEHDTIYDLASATAAIAGASNLVKFIAGSEVTTYVYGHFNAFPLTPRPNQLNNGGIEWFDVSAPDLFRRIRESEEHPVVIQVNHPRGAVTGAYFSAVGLDRDSGTIANAELWSPDFDALEVFNGGCYNGETEVVLDWFDLLNRGYKVALSGGSDTHSEHGLGFPRVFIQTPNQPANFDPQEIVVAYEAMKAFVSCGPFVHFEIAGAGLGELVTQPPVLEAFVEIQAPSWMTFEDFRIIRNGVEIFLLPAKDWSGGGEVTRFRGFVALEPTDFDAWYVLEVRGTGDLWPLHWGPPYALTNPIFVDADGSGSFEPPLLPYFALP